MKSLQYKNDWTMLLRALFYITKDITVKVKILYSLVGMYLKQKKIRESY